MIQAYSWSFLHITLSVFSTGLTGFHSLNEPLPNYQLSPFMLVSSSTKKAASPTPSPNLNNSPSPSSSPSPDPAITALQSEVSVIRKELLDTVKWAFTAAVGLYALVLGLNFVKAIFIDKQDKKNLESEVTETLEKLLREELAPKYAEDLREEIRSDVEALKNTLDAVRSELRFFNYRLTALSAELVANNSVYQYPTALQEYVKAINILCDEYYQKISTDKVGKTEIKQILTYTVEAVLNILGKLKAITQIEELTSYAPSLTSEQIQETRNMLREFCQITGAEFSKFDELLGSLEPLTRSGSS